MLERMHALHGPWSAKIGKKQRPYQAHQTPRYAYYTKTNENTKSTQERASQYIHLAHLAISPSIAIESSDGIFYPPGFRPYFLIEGLESVTAIDSSIR